ncbi:hypothetical protein [Amycolatopsis thermophila]|uniref:Uncharacterized protein n=1 Tax=Amycolatopsis thermophila TaxID=206084 RepID=A0ABU0F1E0_9PSEU|nr:hypothetical protein [Amycolatopsis thermophila]MDQ0381389.1 hypothetical protein [Amycolatopsis thermophila]
MIFHRGPDASTAGLTARLALDAIAAPRGGTVAVTGAAGADHVVERGADVAARIRTLVPGGVAGLVDGSWQAAEVVPAIADGGTPGEVRGWSGPAARGIRVRPGRTVSAARPRTAP